MIQKLKKVLQTVVPQSVIRALKKRPVLISIADVDEVVKNEHSRNYEELIRKVSRRRSAYDEMYNDGVRYLQVGLSAFQCIEQAIKESGKTSIKQILDMACGHGRVLRFIAKSFPNSQLTAADTNKDGIDFCKHTFGAYPIYSNTTIKKFSIAKRFDLIWCGSLATHFNAETTTELFKFFYNHLTSGGLLVFSMHGRITTEYLKTKQETYDLDNESLEKVLKETEATGYGYADYPKYNGYGISVAKPAWIQARLNQVGKWRNYNFYEAAWSNHHDIYSVVKE